MTEINVLEFLTKLKDIVITDKEIESEIKLTNLTQKGEIIGYSYSLFSRIVLRIRTAFTKVYRIEFYNFQDSEKDIQSLFNSPYNTRESMINGQRVISIDIPKEKQLLNETIESLELVLREKINDIYLNYAPVPIFGCCHRMVECSNRKECIIKNSNPIFARGCQYRLNLEAGRIFYGKNRNVH